MSSQALSSNKVFFGLVQFHWGKVFNHVIIFHDVSDVILFYLRKENETFLKGVYFDIKYSSLTIMILVPVVVHNYWFLWILFFIGCSWWQASKTSWTLGMCNVLEYFLWELQELLDALYCMYWYAWTNDIIFVGSNFRAQAKYMHPLTKNQTRRLSVDPPQSTNVCPRNITLKTQMTLLNL